MVVDVVVDGIDQGLDALERAATDALVSNLSEPAFDKVQPGARCRDEVQMEPWVSSEPGFYTGMLVSAVIVHDQVQVDTGRSLAVHYFKKADEFLVTMARHTVADHLAVEHAQCRKQRGCTMAFIVVRHGPTTALLNRQAGLGSIQGLYLALLVDAKYKGLVRGVQVQAHDVGEFLKEMFVTAELEGLEQMGLQIVLLPDPPDCSFAEPLGLSHAARAPVCRVDGIAMESGLDYSAYLFRRDLRDTTRTGCVLFPTRQGEEQGIVAAKAER